MPPLRYLYKIRDKPAGSCSDSRCQDCLSAADCVPNPNENEPLERLSRSLVGAKRRLTDGCRAKTDLFRVCSLASHKLLGRLCQLCRLRG